MTPASTSNTPTEVVLEQYGRTEKLYPLTTDQRAAIRSETRLVEAVEREPSLYQLRAGSFVGTSFLPGLSIIVRPRFGAMGNVFFLLGYGDGLTKWGTQHFPYETEPDFFKAMAWLFEAEVAAALRFGVLRGYEEREELLTALRGRPDVVGQLREAPGRPYPLACRFVEFLDDTEFNRMLKAAIRRVRRLPHLDPSLALRLRHHLSAFEAVGDSPPGMTHDLPHFNRLNEHWRGAAILARLILSQKTLIDRHGRTQGITFAVDLNVLFEAFIRNVVGRIARVSGFELAPANSKPRFSDRARMKPDLIIRRQGRVLAVADAKYKKIVPSGEKWSHANLYQLLAYCVALELETGMLIYAESEGMPSSQVTKGIPKTLQTEEVSLRGTPSEIIERAERVAKLLVQQAKDSASARAGAKSTIAERALRS
jgi:5-methylcytosine-specific restriction enzyme subunit McrC